MLNEIKEQNEFTKNIYIEKAKNILKIPAIILGINVFVYLLMMIYDNFDFGIIFESLTLIFIFFAISSINKKNIELSKKIVIVAMIPIILLIIHDLFIIILNMEIILEILSEISIYYTETYMTNLVGMDLILVIVLLYKVYTTLCKAEGDKRFEEPTDWFYDKK